MRKIIVTEWISFDGNISGLNNAGIMLLKYEQKGE